MILDEELPDLDGFEVLQAIRQADGIVARYDPNLPIVVVTDRDHEDGRDRAFDEGADDFLARRASRSEFKGRIARSCAEAVALEAPRCAWASW